MTVKLTSNKAAAVADDLAFIVRNAIAYIKVLEAELARCKQVCAATSEAWREEAALAEPVPGQGCDHCNSPLYAAVKCRVCGRVTEPAPPQRKPLTEEEIDSIWDSEKAFADIYAIARAIERAHGIGDSDE